MKPLAKPTGVLLEDHIRNLLDEAERVLAMRPFVCRKYRERTGDDLSSALRQSARWHDEGKKHDVWQNACRKDFEEYQRTKKDTGTNIKKAGSRLRHEMASLEFIHRAKASVSLPVRAAVAAHHGKLSHRHQHRWQDRPEFEKFWDEFFAEKHSLRTGNSESFEQAIIKRYRFAGPRAWLQLIDHRASAFEQGERLPSLQPFSYTFPHKEKRGVQLEIEKLWDDRFAILRAPTGAGKTDAALLWAQHQIEFERADHLVVAMPTRFTANALSISTTQENFKNLGDAGLYHSSAWYQRIKDKDHPTLEEKRFIDKEQGLARKLETPFTVTTIDHLCICLTGAREDHHAIFFGLAHSCVVIDEADFYDEFTQQNIVTLLRALRVLDVPILLMSATVPESAKATYAVSGFPLSKIYEDTTDTDRPRCLIKKYGKAEKPDDIANLLKQALIQPTIIYANTVARAQAYYQWFKSRDVDDVVLYHSRFIEPHKVEKENKLREMLGREAWERGEQRGVAILTQIGEISVNISADLMIADHCPLDRLAQRAGRLARFEKRGDGKSNVKGELFVVEPYRFNKKTGAACFYPAPYGTYNSQTGWEMSDALRKSGELLRDGAYSAKRFVELVNELYPSPEQEKSHVRDNRIALEDCVVSNWLILPAEKVEGDDDHTMNWKSRDIPIQYTVYAGYDPTGLSEDQSPPRNKTELREFEIRYGLNCYAYEFNYAMLNSQLEPLKFLIGDELVTRLLVGRQYYDSDVGLNFATTEINDYE